MSVKLEKIEEDWKKAKDNAARWTAKAKELEAKYKEVENTEIHDMVHAANLTPEQLAKLLETLKTGVPQGTIPEEVIEEKLAEKDFENEDSDATDFLKEENTHAW